jgi:F-type H+-transporting ATPase subunit gamma
MANLKEVRVRIASIKSTRQITSAMKMVSASKLRKGQNAILNLRPYEENLRKILNNINKGLEPGERNNLCIPKQGNDALLLIVAGNKGLCGTFNSHLIKAAVIHVRELLQQGYKVKLWIAGKKAEDFFKKSTYPILKTFHPQIDNVTVDGAFTMAREAMQLIENGTFQKIDVVYNRFKNASVYEIRREQFLPMIMEHAVIKDPDHELQDAFGYIMEPSRKEIMDELVPKSIETYMYRILLDSYASEQGARMTAMHKATDNATELLKNLTITYNKVRQSSITNEIVEIVSGAEALNA